MVAAAREQDGVVASSTLEDSSVRSFAEQEGFMACPPLSALLTDSLGVAIFGAVVFVLVSDLLVSMAPDIL